MRVSPARGPVPLVAFRSPRSDPMVLEDSLRSAVLSVTEPSVTRAFMVSSEPGQHKRRAQPASRESRLADQFADLTADRAEQLLGRVYPTGAEASTRHQLATDLVADVRDLDRRIATVQARITAAVTQVQDRPGRAVWGRPGAGCQAAGRGRRRAPVPDQASLRRPQRDRAVGSL